MQWYFEYCFFQGNIGILEMDLLRRHMGHDHCPYGKETIGRFEHGANRKLEMTMLACMS